MAITDKLNEAWDELQENELVFEYRAIIQRIKDELDHSVARINEIAANDNFTTVDPEIIAEGAAIRQEVLNLQAFLNDHAEFVDWTQPE
jgi:hypothetical protein